MLEKIVKIYIDKSLTQEIENKTFDLGKLPAGEAKLFNFWVLNDSEGFLRNIEFTIEHKEIKVVESPSELLGHSVGKLVLEWIPSITIIEKTFAAVRIRAILEI